MKKREKRQIKVLAAAVALTAGSTSLSEAFENPFGAPVERLPMTEAMIDAARAFAKVDVNKDGIVDIDEFAAQRVVYAQLARFNRHVPVDGRVTVRLPIPENVPESLTGPERAALDAVARRDFQLRAAGAEGLDEARWQDARLETFSLADDNGDGELRGQELAHYARYMAGALSIGQSGS